MFIRIGNVLLSSKNLVSVTTSVRDGVVLQYETGFRVNEEEFIEDDPRLLSFEGSNGEALARHFNGDVLYPDLLRRRCRQRQPFVRLGHVLINHDRIVSVVTNMRGGVILQCNVCIQPTAYTNHMNPRLLTFEGPAAEALRQHFTDESLYPDLLRVPPA